MKRLPLIILIVSLFLIGCKEKQENTPQKASKYQTFVSVNTSTSQVAELKQYIKSSGHTKAVKTVDIHADLSSEIIQIKVENNSYVSKGQILLLLDSRDIDIQRAEAEISYNKVLAEFNAWMKTYPQSDSISVASQTGLPEAKLNLEKLDLMLDKCKITAPISGILTGFNLNIGESLFLNQKLATIIDNSQQEIVVDILENEINKVAKGAEVIINFPSMSKRNFLGSVISISPDVDVNTSAGQVVISINTYDDIKSGMFAEVKIETENLGEKLLVPKEALLVRNGRELIFTVSDDNKSQWKYVTSASSNEYLVEIVEGLNPHEKVIVSGNFILAHDANLKLEKEIPFDYYYNKF
jgi:RND family efflux transporter MFP subunit